MHGYVPSIAAIFRRRIAAWPKEDPLRLFVAVKDLVFETAARVLLGFDLSVSSWDLLALTAVVICVECVLALGSPSGFSPLPGLAVLLQRC